MFPVTFCPYLCQVVVAAVAVLVHVHMQGRFYKCLMTPCCYFTALDIDAETVQQRTVETATLQGLLERHPAYKNPTSVVHLWRPDLG